jgi:hypothetical protein
MTALEQATELQEKAILILMTEREIIDARLTQLGYGQEKAPNGKRRGRPSKLSFHSDTTQSGASLSDSADAS